MACAFDPLLVFSSRLGIVACLAADQPASFMELRKLTGLADGNLHVQTRRLIEAGYIGVRKERTDRTRTVFHITELGKRRLKELILTLEQCLERRPAEGWRSAPHEGDDSRVW
jgi:DNA-binding MarR family transcriptional regulator